MTRSGAVSTANIVHTPELLQRLLREKPYGWEPAAFASVLFQRAAAVEERRVQQTLATRSLTGPTLSSGRAVAQFAAEHIRERDVIVSELQSFIADPSFVAVFGADDDASIADGPGIVSAAHRLADYYVRSLELAEECQTCSVSVEYAELIHDCTQLLNLPLRDFGSFLNDFLECLADFQHRAMAGECDIKLDPVVYRITTDVRMVRSVMRRIQAIS
jgi:hypothetical protein